MKNPFKNDDITENIEESKDENTELNEEEKTEDEDITQDNSEIEKLKSDYDIDKNA